MSTTAILPDEQPLDADRPDPQPKTAEEWTPSPDFPWNEDMPLELQSQLLDLAKQQCDEFRYPRRLEVMNAWKGRSFWREMQHINWNWESECWDVLGPAGYNPDGGASQKRDSAVLYSTNIYQGFGKAFLAVITRAVPNLRFEPEDIEEPADIVMAKAADSLRKLIQHENDPIKLMTKAAYYSWTDGRIHAWTRWEVDKRTNQPRETQTIYGSMEVKVPVIYDEECDYPYLQFSTEYHVSTVRDKVKKRAFTDPDYWKKIKGGSTGNGQDIYERTARISVKQGISMKSAGGDAYSHLCTTQRTWMRPTVFLDDKIDEKYRDILTASFPTGCYLEVDNGVYTGSRVANMDDEWAVENVMEGDGSFRNSEGTCLLSVQERFNDTINMTQDTYEKCQRASWWDDKLFNVDAINQQKSMPGAKRGVNMAELPAGDALEQHVFFEPPATVSQDQLAYMEKLSSDVPEGLTGISAVLWGADTGNDKSGKALSIQQAAAMGLIGLPFKVMKRFYARMMEQAVRCSCRNRKEDWSMGVPDETGELETTQVRIEDLKGNVRCFTDSDETYPEDWSAKRAIYLQLMQEGAADSTMKAILSSPENQMLAKRLVGLQELTIPDAISWQKQMVEINLMVNTVPAPPQPIQVPNPLTGDIETLPGQPRSTIPIDPDFDNNAAELITCTIWINGPKGQKAKLEKPQGFMNVRLHALAHKQALMASMMPPPPPPGGPPAAGAKPPAGGAPGGGAPPAGDKGKEPDVKVEHSLAQ